MYITQIYGTPLEKAIEFSVHIQSNVQGKIIYVADLGIGRGFVITASTFDRLIQQIINKVQYWQSVIFDEASPIVDRDDRIVIQEKIREWYGIKRS